MKSKNISKIKIALAIPFATAFIFFFANSTDMVRASEKSTLELVSSDDTTKVKMINNELVYFTVEIMPKFQGKDPDEFRVFIMENLKYPKKAQKEGAAGRVFVSFVVDIEGKVKNAEVVRGVHPLLDKEALRVVSLSPKWKPGMDEGKAVNVQFTFPIVFQLK